MELIACRCDVGYGLPHDHRTGSGVIDGVYQAIYDTTDIGRLWVNWKAFARELLEADACPPPTTIPCLTTTPHVPTGTAAGALAMGTALAPTSPGKDPPPDVHSMD